MKVLALVGPTATGKSEVAVAFALREGGCEIVSADSMQVYRNMDIGTAKPGSELTSAAPHHLIDIVEPHEEFTVVQFQAAARAAIAEICERRHLPLLVGGSGLYVRAVVDPLDFHADEPGTKRRKELEELAAESLEALLERLEAVDPEALDHVETGNPRRVIRAIEAFERTGLPFTVRRRRWQERRSIYDLMIVGLTLPRAELIARIDARVDRMVESGLVEEVRAVYEQNGGLSKTAAQALGYKEFGAYLRGEQSLDGALEDIRVRTRQFAKRQMTWYRADPRVHWLDVTGLEAGNVAERISALVNEKRFIVS